MVEKTTPLGDGELRGDRSYCVLPPSQHPEGDNYRWIVEPNGDVPVVDPELAGLGKEAMQQRQLEQSEANRRNLIAGERGDDEIELAIQGTLPTGPGQRNQQVFQLCRALKGIDRLADADPQSLRPIVQRWHEKALPHIRTKPFEETWIDFLYGWPRVEVPMRENLMENAMERARANPEEGADYDQQKVRLLLSLCRELQAINGQQPFFLSSRTAGRLLGVDPTTAWRWLYLLDKDKWIKLIERGGQSHNPRKASRFKYLGRMDAGE